MKEKRNSREVGEGGEEEGEEDIESPLKRVHERSATLDRFFRENFR